MKKDLYSMCKGFLVMALLCFSMSAFAQEIRYEITAAIDKDGVRRSVNDGAIKISYYNQAITLSFLGGGDPQYNTFKYKYHHSENGNTVYYQVARDIMTGQESLNPDGVVVVAADKSLVNLIQLMRGVRQYTHVYERKDEGYGTMAR